jgi:hypothetical protein
MAQQCTLFRELKLQDPVASNLFFAIFFLKHRFPLLQTTVYRHL